MAMKARLGSLLCVLVAGGVAWGQDTIAVSPTSLSFCVPSNQTSSPAPAVLTVASNSPTPVSATAGQSWIKLGAATGVTNLLLPVSIEATGFSPNTYTGTVTLTAGSNTKAIPVTLVVSSNPIVCFENGPTDIWYQVGSGSFPSPSVLRVSSSDGSAVGYTLDVNPGSAGNFLLAGPAQGTTPANLVTALDPDVVAKLPIGTYPIDVNLTSPGGKSPTVSFTLHVTSATTLDSQQEVNVPYQLGSTLLAPQEVDVSTSDSSAEDVIVQPLGCSLGAGPLTGATPLTIHMGVVVPLPTQAGVCRGSLILTAMGVANSPAIVPVTVVTSTRSLLGANSNGLKFQTPYRFDPAGEVVDVTSTDPNTSINFTARPTTLNGGNWLELAQTTGSTPATLTVTPKAGTLPPRPYFGGITFTDTLPTGPQTIPVTLIIAAQASATPSSLTFTQPFGGSNPAGQTVSVTSNPSGSAFTATTATTSGGNWLSAAPVTGTTPGNITVSANGAGLGPGGYTGNVVITVGGDKINVPAALDVTGATEGIIVNPPSLVISYTLGSPQPGSQTVKVSSTGAPVAFTASAISNNCGNFLSVSPTSATTPATFTVNISPVGPSQGPGTCTGLVTFGSTQGGAAAAVPINLVITSNRPQIGAIVNSATQQPGPVSPGEIITIYGTNTGPATPVGLQITSQGKVATELGNTQVFFDGVAAPLIYVSATQVNAIVPYEVTGRTATGVTIGTANGTGGVTSPVANTTPGIFTANQTGKGQGAVLNQNGAPNNATNPAAKGSVIQVFGTGGGTLNPPQPTGSFTPTNPPFPKPLGPVTLTFVVPGSGGGGVTIPATIQFAGEAPGLVSGVLQVNAVVPMNAVSGTNTVVLTVGSNSSPSVVTVQVQ